MSDHPIPVPSATDRTAVRSLRELLKREGYTGPVVCHRLGIESLFDFRSLRAGRGSEVADGASVQPTDSLGVLVYLFLDGEALPARVIEDHLGGEALAALRALGLIMRPIATPDRNESPDDSEHRSETLAAAALLYPVGPIWVASDLNAQAPGALGPDAALPHDAVYPAIADPNRGFLRDLPDTPVEGEILDLCAGTGVGALLSASLAPRVWSLDLTPRATEFAGFNAALNGRSNVEARAGDLYEPVRGRRFERIVAHPPYLPSLSGDHIFRDGGVDGERVLRRIVEGLPEHLAPGGLFYGHGMGTDHRDAPLEQRLRGFLGEHEKEFTVTLLWTRTHSPLDFVWSRVRTGRCTADEGLAHLEDLARRGVERFVQGTILIERSGKGSRVRTERRPRGDGGGWTEIEACLRRVDAARGTGDEPEGVGGDGLDVTTLRPRLPPSTEVEMRYRNRDGEITPTTLRLHATGPLPATAAVPVQLAPVLGYFDGSRTPAEVLDEGIRTGRIPAGVPQDEFLAMVRSLLEAGILSPGRDEPEGERGG